MTLILDKLQSGQAIVDGQGRPTPYFMTLMQRRDRQIEDAVTAIEAVNVEQASQLAQIIAAQNSANAAQDAAEQGAREIARIASYTSPTAVLEAGDDGTDATIEVFAHTRIYPVQGSLDVPDLAITGSLLVGLLPSTTYAVYYDDVSLADTTPAFVASTDIGAAQVGAAPGRHFLGVITTGAIGDPPSTGGGTYPPGSGSGGEIP